MTAVFDDGKYRFPVEIVRGSLRWPAEVLICGVRAVLDTAQPTIDGGYIYSFWIDCGIGFKLWSRDLHEVESPDSDFTVLGK